MEGSLEAHVFKPQQVWKVVEGLGGGDLLEEVVHMTAGVRMPGCFGFRTLGPSLAFTCPTIMDSPSDLELKQALSSSSCL